MGFTEKEIHELSDRDLTFWLSELHEEKKTRRYRATQDNKFILAPGMKVKVNHKKALGKMYTVDRVKLKKAFLFDESGLRWNVALSLIEQV